MVHNRGGPLIALAEAHQRGDEPRWRGPLQAATKKADVAVIAVASVEVVLAIDVMLAVPVRVFAAVAILTVVLAVAVVVPLTLPAAVAEVVPVSDDFQFRVAATRQRRLMAPVAVVTPPQILDWRWRTRFLPWCWPSQWLPPMPVALPQPR